MLQTAIEGLKFFTKNVFVFLLLMAQSFALPLANNWENNNIGKEEIVLPGFSPLIEKGFVVYLSGDREYHWDNSYLPVRISVKNQPYVVNNKLTMVLEGRSISLVPDSIKIIEKNEHHVVIKAIGKTHDDIQVSVVSRIEYDGLLQSEISISSPTSVVIDSFYYEGDIAASEWTKMLQYQPENIHRRKKKAFSEPVYSGDFLSVLALVDGDRSYWWFMDSLESTEAQKGEVRTRVVKKENSINIKQYLVLDNKKSRKKLNYSINLLVGPVKDSISNVRANRVARRINQEESEIGGIYYWWLTAFIHQALPFVEYDEFFKAGGNLNGMHEFDRDVYQGVYANRKKILEARYKNISLLPYFSAHLLNKNDPVYQSHSDEWHALPHREMRIADKPYKTKRADIMLTHRAEGYSDYLLYQISQAIDKLGIEGIYFDQGGVLNSNNLLNGGWVDSHGNARSATEIIALRSFFKRLATLFHSKGKSGTVIAHNSNTMVLPAYSFVAGMLQGEEFIHSLEDHDYIKTISSDEVRTRLGSSAFGVPTIWLSELWVANKRLEKSKRKVSLTQKEWLNTEAYRIAFEGLMAIALLHDIPVQSYAPLELRSSLFSALDWVNPDNAEFVGYWSTDQKANNDVLWSLYRNDQEGRIAVIISNLSSSSVIFDLDGLMKNKVFSDISCRDKSENDEDSIQSPITIDRKSFFILQLFCDGEAS